MTEYEKKVDEIVDSLGCSIAEAEQILKDDQKINKGERMEFDLSPEEEKKALKLANVTTHKKKPLNLNLPKKEKKPDPTKEETVSQLAKFLADSGYADVEITNKTKIIAFKIGNENFELNLIRKRPKKK